MKMKMKTASRRLKIESASGLYPLHPDDRIKHTEGPILDLFRCLNQPCSARVAMTDSRSATDLHRKLERQEQTRDRAAHATPTSLRKEVTLSI